MIRFEFLEAQNHWSLLPASLLSEERAKPFARRSETINSLKFIRCCARRNAQPRSV